MSEGKHINKIHEFKYFFFIHKYFSENITMEYLAYALFLNDININLYLSFSTLTNFIFETNFFLFVYF